MVNETEITIERASQLTGFSRHHLERLIKVGVLKTKDKDGVLMLDVSSLEHYSQKRAEKSHKKVELEQSTDEESIVMAGVKYVSLNRAARLSGYTQEYIHTIAREGTIETKQFGERQYISIESLFAHRRAIHAQQAKWYEQQPKAKKTDEPVKIHRVSIYSKDSTPLFPVLAEKKSHTTHLQEEQAPVVHTRVAVIDKPQQPTPSPFHVGVAPQRAAGRVLVETPRRSRAVEQEVEPQVVSPRAVPRVRTGTGLGTRILQLVTVSTIALSIYFAAMSAIVRPESAAAAPLIGNILSWSEVSIVFSRL
jgi:hypothetical protein